MTNLLTNSKPYVRWWWLGGPFRTLDIDSQLKWIQGQGFGGVEIAWVYPTWNPPQSETPEWLSEQWQDLVCHAKRVAEELQLGCDFTFGSAWPFGGMAVDDRDASQTLDGISSDRLWGAWDDRGQSSLPVLDHLCARSLRNYAAKLAPAFQPAMEVGAASGLFCDSWELDSRRIWSEQLWDEFEAQFNYDLRDHVEHESMSPDVRYDYLKFLDRVVRENFYREFTAIAQSMGGFSRIQIHGSPTDPIAAYAEADIPETEALLYEPHFSRIGASAAAMSDKPMLSCESFTCIYGFPDRYLGDEDIRDLKLLADALLAEGVNHFVWHGMPYQPSGQTERFYANCHVGPDGTLAKNTRDLNAYLANVCEVMRRGQTHSLLAVYLPREDEIMKGKFGRSEFRIQGENHRWEMRRVRMPNEFAGYNPLWISETFLRMARANEGKIQVGPIEFAAICVDVEWLDRDSLAELERLSSEGARIVLLSNPRQPGRNRAEEYTVLRRSLQRSAVGSIADLNTKPLIQGQQIPPFFARRDDNTTYFFFANPATQHIAYPMYRGQAAETTTPIRVPITIQLNGRGIPFELQFDDLDSIIIAVKDDSEPIVLDQPLRFE